MDKDKVIEALEEMIERYKDHETAVIHLVAYEIVEGDHWNILESTDIDDL